MNQKAYKQHINAIAAATTNKGVKEIVTLVMAAHGFQRWLYASDNPYGVFGLPVTLANEYGKWMLTYMAKSYQKVDPIVSHCRASNEPLLWDSLQGWDKDREPLNAFMSDVAAHGFGSGIAIPLHLSDEPQGLLNVTSATSLHEARAHFEKTLPRLVQVGYAMHTAMINIMKMSVRPTL